VPFGAGPPCPAHALALLPRCPGTDAYAPIRQGRPLDRAGDITSTADPDGTIWVGGNTNTLFRGTAYA